jgi:hypothetical protein
MWQVRQKEGEAKGISHESPKQGKAIVSRPADLFWW